MGSPNARRFRTFGTFIARKTSFAYVGDHRKSHFFLFSPVKNKVRWRQQSSKLIFFSVSLEKKRSSKFAFSRSRLWKINVEPFRKESNPKRPKMQQKWSGAQATKIWMFWQKSILKTEVFCPRNFCGFLGGRVWIGFGYARIWIRLSCPRTTKAGWRHRSLKLDFTFSR